MPGVWVTLTVLRTIVDYPDVDVSSGMHRMRTMTHAGNVSSQEG